MMRRVIGIATILALLTPMTGALSGDEKTPTIAEIMQRAHKRNKLRDQIKAGVDKSQPDWNTVRKMSKEFVELASALEKNDPPLGDKEGWVKLSKDYANAVRALDEAVGKKDAKVVLDANKALGSKCLDCHRDHRE